MLQKMVQVYHTFNVDFNDNASVFNAVSKAVQPVETATDILGHEDIDKEMYKSFVDGRIKGEVSIWLTMKKLNLKTFGIQGKSIKTKIGEKLAQLKEKPTLLSHFLITTRKRPELDLEGSIENYEFSVVPKSIFTPDGRPLHSFDKAKILHAIGSMVKNEETSTDETNLDATVRVIIIDGMALANKFEKNKNMKTLKAILTGYLVEP